MGCSLLAIRRRFEEKDLQLGKDRKEWKKQINKPFYGSGYQEMDKSICGSKCRRKGWIRSAKIFGMGMSGKE